MRINFSSNEMQEKNLTIFSLKNAAKEKIVWVKHQIIFEWNCMTMKFLMKVLQFLACIIFLKSIPRTTKHDTAAFHAPWKRKCASCRKKMTLLFLRLLNFLFTVLFVKFFRSRQRQNMVINLNSSPKSGIQLNLNFRL